MPPADSLAGNDHPLDPEANMDACAADPVSASRIMTPAFDQRIGGLQVRDPGDDFRITGHRLIHELKLVSGVRDVLPLRSP